MLVGNICWVPWRETSAIAILIGGAYLLYKGTVSWYVPCIISSGLHFAFLSARPRPHLSSFCRQPHIRRLFYATDVVTSPVTKLGRIIFGAGAGVLTIVIRVFGGFPEGVCYSILLMNGVTPLIDRYTRRLPKSAARSNLAGESLTPKG